MSDREILASLVGAVRAGRQASEDDTLLNGMFKQMLEPKEFRRMVYPGLSPAETAKLPQSLQDVVCDARYAADVKQLVPLAKEKAKSVLDAVKARAAKEGDLMDAATEAALYPSVFQEAFARALVSMVTATGRSAHVAEVSGACDGTVGQTNARDRFGGPAGQTYWRRCVSFGTYGTMDAACTRDLGKAAIK
jgi:hypothetical protein